MVFRFSFLFGKVCEMALSPTTCRCTSCESCRRRTLQTKGTHTTSNKMSSQDKLAAFETIVPWTKCFQPISYFAATVRLAMRHRESESEMPRVSRCAIWFVLDYNGFNHHMEPILVSILLKETRAKNVTRVWYHSLCQLETYSLLLGIKLPYDKHVCSFTVTHESIAVAPMIDLAHGNQ